MVALRDSRTRLPSPSEARGETLEPSRGDLYRGDPGLGSAQTVSVSGVDIATYIDGEQNHPWIVLSNSLAADYSSWHDQLSLLAQSFRVLRYDTRGHGRNSAPEGPYTFDHLTGDVLGLMDHYGIEKANFLGLSMGGMTGLGLAIDHPSRVTRPICCDARSDAPPPFVDNWTARIASVESAGNMEPVATFNRERWFTPAFVASHPWVVDKAMKMILATSTRGYVGCARALQKLDYKRHLGRIECPTLFICGAQDAASSPAVMQEMTGLVPIAAIKLVDPGAHVCNVENPEGFNATVSEWLSR
jgi:3-oxoadipate enol-lactonase